MWVPTLVLQYKTSQQRADILSHLINVAKKCEVVRNFNACYALVGGFSHSSISRLNVTWEVRFVFISSVNRRK
jgi:son of sevenless-like protein